jgi:hypothetical protein
MKIIKLEFLAKGKSERALISNIGPQYFWILHRIFVLLPVTHFNLRFHVMQNDINGISWSSIMYICPWRYVRTVHVHASPWARIIYIYIYIYIYITYVIAYIIMIDPLNYHLFQKFNWLHYLLFILIKYSMS